MGKLKLKQEKRKRANAARATKLTKTVNPFEVKVNNKKFNILGRKHAHDRGLPGLSRTKANKKRKQTLLKEYKNQRKANVLSDERFGEHVTELSLPDKMLQRFAIEKKRKHDRVSMFNLNDTEELTHMGQSLSEIKTFDEIDVSDEDDGMIGEEYVADAHFGGGIFSKIKQENDFPEEENTKSRKEIIDEIIMKSKTAKMIKQNDKEEANTICEKLDNTWQEVERLLKSSKRTKRADEDVRRDRREMSDMDSYDLAVRQMKFDAKAAPAKDGKSEAEKHAEELARMRTMDEEQRRRMNPESNEVNKKGNHRSADDLNQDYVQEKVHVDPVVYKDGKMVPNAQFNDSLFQDDEMKECILNQDEDVEGEKEQSEEESEYSDIDSEEECDDSNDHLKQDVDKNQTVSKGIMTNNSSSKAADRDLRKSGQFPEDYQEFKSYVERKFPSCPEKYIEMLSTKYASHLAERNKDKLLKVFEHLWNLLVDLFSGDYPAIDEAKKLTPHLYKLCQIQPQKCAEYIVDQLKTKYIEFCSSRKVPSFGTIMCFKFVKILFSTSDFIHPVAGPAMLFMCNILHSCRPKDLRELSACLFISTLIYEYVHVSKKFVPEVINFLCSVICMAISGEEKGSPIYGNRNMNNRNRYLLLPTLANRNNLEKLKLATKPDLLKLICPEELSELNTDEVKIELLLTAVRLLIAFVRLNSQLPCFKEIFEPIKASCIGCTDSLKEIFGDSQNIPVFRLMKELQTEIDNAVNRKPLMKPLTAAKSNKPKMLPLLDPKVEYVSDPFKKSNRKNSGPVNCERERLLHKFKREQKGAMREIRKDSRFIAQEQLNEQLEKDKDRAEKVKRLYGLLSNQEGEVKNIKRKKYKLDIA